MKSFLTTTSICILMDQITKFAVGKFLNHQTVEILPFLNLLLVHNRGFAFGLGQDFNNLLKDFFYFLLPFLVVVFIIYIGIFKIRNSCLKFSLGLIAGGGMGNLVDRIFLGKVRDFIDFHIGNWHYPAFNVADVCVSLGIILLLFHMIFSERKGKV